VLIAAAIVVAVLAVGGAVAALGGGGDDDSSGGVVEDLTNTTEATTGGTGSLEDAKLTAADLPAGWEETADQFAVIPIAACAGAAERPESTEAESIVTSFIKGADGPGVRQSLYRFTSGAEAEYASYARAIADCRAKSDVEGGFVSGAAALALDEVGDERTGARVLLGQNTDPADPPFILDAAVLRVGDKVMVITASGPSGSIEPAFIEDLFSKTAGRLT
jgi:hypothetical protein